MANRHDVQKRARGGRVFYAGGGSKTAKEAFSTKGGFKDGGAVPGMKSGGRLDKRARGGGVYSSAGGGGADRSPFSSAKRGK